MKVLFVNDSTSNPNWGDRAAATALRTMITSMGGQITYSLTELALSATQFEPFVPQPQTAERQGRVRRVVRQVVPPGVASVGRRVRPRRRLIPDTWEGFPRAAHEAAGMRTPWPELTQAIKDADVVVIHGDGAMTGNGIIPRTILFITYLAKRFHGTPVIIVNHTADFSHPDLREIARHVYPLFDDVVFRDPISAQDSQGIGAGGYAADATFLFEPAERAAWIPVARRPTYFDVWPDTATFDPSEPYLCLGGSSILAASSRTDGIISGYQALIRQLRSTYAGSIVLTVSDLMDQSLFRQLAQEFDLPLVGLDTPIQQVMDILGNADAYIGGRWHPSIFALRGGTPIVPLSAKTTKMEGLASMLGMTSALPDAADLEPAVESLGRQLQDCLDGGADLRVELRQWADEQARGCWDNVAFLKTL